MRWRSIKTAPRDGTGILLTDGHFVHYGWWHGNGKHPWAMVDSHDMQPNGCCDMEKPDTISPNGWLEGAPKYWMPMPAAKE